MTLNWSPDFHLARTEMDNKDIVFQVLTAISLCWNKGEQNIEYLMWKQAHKVPHKQFLL